MARDRLGKKPLYYTIVNGSFIFASELNALRAQGAGENRLQSRSAGMAATRSLAGI